MKALFENIYEDHADLVFRHIYFRISDRERAKEISQDVFMRLWEYLNKGNDIENVKSFLMVSARNAVINEYRARKNDVSLDEMLEHSGDKIEDESLLTLETRLEVQDLMDCLKELPEGHRDMLVYKYIDDMTTKDIAEATGETESNVSVKIHRATKKLRSIIEEKEMTIKEE